jgi:hypothetical protein
LNEIKQKITNPDFSYKRKKDLESLVKLIEKKIKYNKNENISYNEQDALYLTLKKYVNLENLKKRLEEFDISLIEYYKSNKVKFSSGKCVDFDFLGSQPETVYGQLAERIYKTRNAIVHSKDRIDKLKYKPFRDDKVLIKEIPLMRAISEEIIINSSEIL